MAGRPSLVVGTYGKIRYVDLKDGRVQARALFRDFDGHTRPVTRIGTSETDARRNLTTAMRDRQRVAGDDLIRSDMRIAALADVWLERIDASDKAVNTKQQYRKLVKGYIKPALGQLRLQEATVPAVDRALKTITRERGLAVARSCRAVLSGMLGLAARHGAIQSNPVRDTEPVAGASVPKRGRPRALTVAEAEDLSDKLRSNARAVEQLDLADVVDFCLGTGARIGEVLACRYDTNGDGMPLLDLEAGTWEVNATVVRVAGRGLTVQERTKTQAGWRVLALPPHIVDMLRERPNSRWFQAPHGVVFGSPARRSLRDPSNIASNLKEVLTAIGYTWPTFHAFRRTVATRMSEAGCTVQEVADQLGHSKPSMTADKYLGRSVVSARAATILLPSRLRAPA